MHATIHGERTLTDLDFARLSKLLGRELLLAVCYPGDAEPTGDYSK